MRGGNGGERGETAWVKCGGYSRREEKKRLVVRENGRERKVRNQAKMGEKREDEGREIRS